MSKTRWTPFPSSIEALTLADLPTRTIREIYIYPTYRLWQANVVLENGEWLYGIPLPFHHTIPLTAILIVLRRIHGDKVSQM